jgi:hypothetical protein
MDFSRDIQDYEFGSISKLKEVRDEHGVMADDIKSALINGSVVERDGHGEGRIRLRDESQPIDLHVVIEPSDETIVTAYFRRKDSHVEASA